MESQRSFLLIGLAMVGFLMWQQWQIDYGPKPVEQNSANAVQAGNSQNSNGDAPQLSSPEQMNVANVTTVSDKVISVITGTLLLSIDTKGGDVISANLADFPVSEGSTESYSLLRPNGEHIFVAQSGLVGRDGTDSKVRPIYSTEKDSYVLTGDTLSVPLTYSAQNGMNVVKTFTFTKGSHQIDVNYQITNNSSSSKQVQQFGQLKQSMVEQGGSMFMPTYRGGAYSTEEKRYEKYSFDDIAEKDNKLNKVTKAGWAAMIEHYFVSAWVPPQDQTNTIYSAVRQNTNAVIGFTGEVATIEPGQTAEINSILYLGPKDQDTLESIARGLDLTVDYGFLFMISKPLFWLLQYIHSIVGNWGFAIIIITIIVKGSMFWLTKKQYESMAKMRALKPKMDALKERFGDDKQKMQKAMMELYKKDKVNPLGGCLPLLFQMPIFLALYWVLLESVELRQANFIFWITDLSVKDPYFVLPILTGISMYLLQKLQPMTMTDPMQQKIMQFMPVAMSLFFFIFPAGLVLYWLISNLITLVQAKFIYASMEKRGLQTK